MAICQYLCQYALMCFTGTLFILSDMKQFKQYFSERAIITQICKVRVKLAKSRNKKHLIHLLTDSEKYNYHKNETKNIYENEFSEYQFLLNNHLSKILPPRKKWVKLGYQSRKRRDSNELLSSNDKSFYSLLKTIKLYKKKEPKAIWLQELDKFVKEIQQSAIDENYRINEPIIFPKLKNDYISEREINKCRPISMFSLKDRIILSITNKFLTKLFDESFQDSSYAFRAKQNKDKTAVLSHHDTITDVIQYQKDNDYNPLYVVECDIRKFYDSVNHKVVQDLFSKLIIEVKKDFPYISFGNAKHIFKEYLNSYSFNNNVPSENDFEYWKSYKIPKGVFEWVKDDIIKSNFYSNIENERIGVPQGGALSGLIANIVLNESDKKMLDTDVFYVRFCDDMLIIHNDKKKCEIAKKVYLKTLDELKLIAHPFVDKLKKELDDSKYSFEPFWHTKSKGPYKWHSIEKNGFPWIGFVGYEIHHKGYTRVRKSSLFKELKKQKKIIAEIEKAIEKGQRKTKGTVLESAINRLIGMSVGRIGLKNFDEASTDMCWKNGFKELKLNKFSSIQIKQLDRNRSKLYYDLLKSVKDIKKDDDENNDDNEGNTREVIHYDKPFSYFYQILERNK